MTINNKDSNSVNFKTPTHTKDHLTEYYQVNQAYESVESPWTTEETTLQSLPTEIKELIIDKTSPQEINFCALKYLIQIFKIPPENPLSLLPVCIRPSNQPLLSRRPLINLSPKSLLKLMNSLKSA